MLELKAKFYSYYTTLVIYKCISFSADQIYDLILHSRRVYYELTKWLASSELDSSPHQYRTGHGFESRSSLIIFML